VDPDVAIMIVFCVEIALVALGGGYVVRYEMRRAHAAKDPRAASRGGTT
jgi:hypothetical protein